MASPPDPTPTAPPSMLTPSATATPRPPPTTFTASWSIFEPLIGILALLLLSLGVRTYLVHLRRKQHRALLGSPPEEPDWFLHPPPPNREQPGDEERRPFWKGRRERLHAALDAWRAAAKPTTGLDPPQGIEMSERRRSVSFSHPGPAGNPRLLVHPDLPPRPEFRNPADCPDAGDLVYGVQGAVVLHGGGSSAAFLCSPGLLRTERCVVSDRPLSEIPCPFAGAAVPGGELVAYAEALVAVLGTGRSAEEMARLASEEEGDAWRGEVWRYEAGLREAEGRGLDEVEARALQREGEEVPASPREVPGSPRAVGSPRMGSVSEGAGPGSPRVAADAEARPRAGSDARVPASARSPPGSPRQPASPDSVAIRIDPPSSPEPAFFPPLHASTAPAELQHPLDDPPAYSDFPPVRRASTVPFASYPSEPASISGFSTINAYGPRRDNNPLQGGLFQAPDAPSRREPSSRRNPPRTLVSLGFVRRPHPPFLVPGRYAGGAAVLAWCGRPVLSIPGPGRRGGTVVRYEAAKVREGDVIGLGVVRRPSGQLAAFATVNGRALATSKKATSKDAPCTLEEALVDMDPAEEAAALYPALGSRGAAQMLANFGGPFMWGDPPGEEDWGIGEPGPPGYEEVEEV